MTQYREALRVIDGLYNTVEAVRAADGLSLRQLGEQCGVNYTALSRFERDQSSMSVTSIRKLLTWLDARATGPECACAAREKATLAVRSGEERSGRVVSGQASREETAGKTEGRGPTTSGAPEPNAGTATPAPPDLLASLLQGQLSEVEAVVRQLCARVSAHERALHPRDADGLPAPTRRIDRGRDMDGLYWERADGYRRWSVGVLDDPEAAGHLYVHTPQGMGGDPGDVEAVDHATALWLAGALIAAHLHSVDDLSRRRLARRKT